MQHSPDLSFKESVEQLNREAAGLLRCEVIRPADIGPMTRAALGGDLNAFVRLSASWDSAAKIKSLSRKKQVVCLCCPRSIHDPHATLALLFPATDQATIAIASAVCQKCSIGDHDTLLGRVAAAFQECWPNLRPVEITHPEGSRA